MGYRHLPYFMVLTVASMPAGRPPVPKLKEVQPPMPRNPYEPSTRCDDGKEIFQPTQASIRGSTYSQFT
jgi:wee1-like protein kinase